MRATTLVVYLSVFIASEVVFGAKLPSSFKKCKRDDPDCLTQAISNVLPQLVDSFAELGLPSLEPLKVPSIVIEGGNGPVDVAQKFYNVDLRGITKSKVHTAKFDWDKKEIVSHLHIPIILEGDYELDGRILLLPIRGKGKSVIDLMNTDTVLTMPFETITKKGKEYLKFSNTKITLKPSKVTFEFENLFDGDKALSENIHKVLNENWNDLFEDVRSGYEKVFATICESTANSLFSRVPIDEVFEKN